VTAQLGHGQVADDGSASDFCFNFLHKLQAK
jgi:hypothetical protein